MGHRSKEEKIMLDDVIKIAARVNRLAEKQAKVLGISQDGARFMLGDAIITVLGHLDKDSADIQKLLDEHLDTEAESGVPWAVELRTATRDKTRKEVRAAYDKALAAGVDPVAVVMADCRLPKEAAEQEIASLSEDAVSDEAPF
jgi:hypothetical protein